MVPFSSFLPWTWYTSLELYDKKQIWPHMRLLQSCVLAPEFEDTYIAIYSVMSFEFVFVVPSNISKIIPAQSVLKGDGIGHRSWKIGPRIRSSHHDKWFNFWFSLVRILPLCENFFLKCLDSLNTTVFTPNNFQSSSACTDATLHHVLQAMLHPEHSIRTNAGPPYLQYKF